MSEHVDALARASSKLQNRIDHAYRPFSDVYKSAKATSQNDEQRGQRSRRVTSRSSVHGLDENADHSNDGQPSRGSGSHHLKQKNLLLRKLRDSKREKHNLANIGRSSDSIREFVLRREQEEDTMKLIRESEKYAVDIETYLNDESKASDREYDADYEEDQPSDIEDFKAGDNRSSFLTEQKTREMAQQQLEEMLKFEELELEMMTANMSLMDHDGDDDDNDDENMIDTDIKGESSQLLNMSDGSSFSFSSD